MGVVPALCGVHACSSATSSSSGGAAAAVKRPSKTPGSSAASAAAAHAAKARQARRTAERVRQKGLRAKRSSVPELDGRDFRAQYTIVRGWKPKKKRNSGVGGGLRDAWGIWDIAVDMTSSDQPHRIVVAVPTRSLACETSDLLRDRIKTLTQLGFLYDAFIQERDLLLLYDHDPEEAPPVLDVRAPITEETACSWARDLFASLLLCHERGIFLGTTALSRVVGSTLQGAVLLGVGVLGGIVSGPWELDDTELGPDWLEFVAPELILSRGAGGDSCGVRANDVSDAWTAGMLLFALLSGGSPFDARQLRHQGPSRPVLDFAPRFDGEQWLEVSPACIELLEGLLASDPRRRWSIGHALSESAWLRPHGDGGRSLARSRTVLNEFSSFRDRAQRFRQSSALRRAARLFVAEQLPRSSILQVEKAFRQADTDADGLLSASEVRAALEDYGLEPPAGLDLDELVLEVGAGDARGVDLVEFAAVLLDEQLLLEHENLLSIFRRIDKDGSGKITREALFVALATSGGSGLRAHNSLEPSELDELIELADLDGDGRIDFEEFVRLLRMDGGLLTYAPDRGNDGPVRLIAPCACCTAEVAMCRQTVPTA